MDKVKGQGHVVDPVSDRTSFSFHINRINHSWDMFNICLTLKNTSEISKEN